MLTVHLKNQWDSRSYVYMFCSLTSWQKAYVMPVFDAENLSVSLVSEGQTLCLPNPSDKTDVNISVTQTFIQVFI